MSADKEEKPNSTPKLSFEFVNHSVLLLVCVVLFVTLLISTKDKINMDFSKKSNRRIIKFFVLVLCYIFRGKVNKVYQEIRKDAINPGSGFIGQTLNNAKQKVIELNKGSAAKKYEDLKQAVKELQTPMEFNYSVNPVITQQLRNGGAIGYVLTDEGVFYSVKSNVSSEGEYVLERKIDRSTMQVKSVNIDAQDSEYKEIYNRIQYKENLSKDLQLNSILVKPSDKATLKKNVGISKNSNEKMS